MGALAFGTDHWFEFTADVSALATEVVRLLDRFGLPFLEQFPDYPSVLAYYEAHGCLPFQNSGRASLEAGIIAHHLRDAHKAQYLLAKAHSSENQGFRKYVSTLAGRLGMNVA